jgi:predicted P-loop ATPase
MSDEGKIDSKKSYEIKKIGTGFFTKMLNYYKNKDKILKERESIVNKISNILKEI